MRKTLKVLSIVNIGWGGLASLGGLLDGAYAFGLIFIPSALMISTGIVALKFIKETDENY